MAIKKWADYVAAQEARGTQLAIAAGLDAILVELKIIALTLRCQ